MTLLARLSLPLLLSSALVQVAISQTGQSKPTATAAKSAPVTAVRQPYFGSARNLGLDRLLLSPPADDSPEAAAELSEVHRVERTRTLDQVHAAQYDDTHEDLFIYANILTNSQNKPVGEVFSAVRLPVTAALSAHMRSDAGLIDNPLKEHFHRLRPYNFDKTLHPVCETNQGFSYPSGHSINGYLYAFALAEMLPEQSARILARAQEYAQHRVVCGVHYPSDIEASRRVASFVFGYLLAQPAFQRDLEAARQEIRGNLGFPSDVAGK
jgi:acid phosphatase (class A)